MRKRRCGKKYEYVILKSHKFYFTNKIILVIQMEIAFSIIFWTLALYGLFEIIKSIIYIWTYTKLNSKGIYLLVAVKDQENNIECFLRTLLFKIIYGKQEVDNVIVVDLNSKDNTKKIVENLEKEYDNLSLINLKECKELLENINM